MKKYIRAILDDLKNRDNRDYPPIPNEPKNANASSTGRRSRSCRTPAIKNLRE